MAIAKKIKVSVEKTSDSSVKFPKIGSFVTVDWSDVTPEAISLWIGVGHPAIGARLLRVASTHEHDLAPLCTLHTVPISKKHDTIAVMVPLEYIKFVTQRKAAEIKRQFEWFRTSRIRNKADTEHPYTKIFQ